MPQRICFALQLPGKWKHFTVEDAVSVLIVRSFILKGLPRRQGSPPEDWGGSPEEICARALPSSQPETATDSHQPQTVSPAMPGLTKRLPPATEGRPGPVACEATMRRHPQHCHDHPRSGVADSLSFLDGDISLSGCQKENIFMLTRGHMLQLHGMRLLQLLITVISLEVFQCIERDWPPLEQDILAMWF